MMTGRVSQAALAGWKDLLPHRDLGCLPQFNSLDFNEPIAPGVERQIALSEFVGFLEAESRLIRRSDFFWRAGENYDLSFLGFVGEAVLSAKTLGGALSRFATYFSLLQDATEMNFEVDHHLYATLSYRILDPSIWSRSTDADFTLGIVAQLIRTAVGEKWPHAEVIFEIDSPKWGHDISDYLRTQCIYGGPKNMIRIPVSWLNEQMAITDSPNSTLVGLNEELVYQRRISSIRDRARYHIYRNIGFGNIDQTTIAKEMGMSRRTLRRKLAEHGLSFQGIVDACRMKVAALEMKRRPGVSLTEIALMLGYTEHSSFTRAFNRWNGAPPQQFRIA